MKHRILCAIMTSILLIPHLAACSEPATAPETVPESIGSTTMDTDAETKSEAELVLEAVPAVDWGGEDFTILYNESVQGYKGELYSAGAAGDKTSSATMSEAVFERNTLFAERCHLTLHVVGKEQEAVLNAINAEVTTASGDYQFISLNLDLAASKGTENMLYNYLDVDNVDYERPWWDAGTLDFAIAGKVFLMNGAHNYMDDNVTFMMFFNKKLVNDRGIANPYDVVRAGNWTLEFFGQSIQGMAEDSNGDGQMNEEDTYGFVAPDSVGNTFFYGAGLQYIVNTRDMPEPALALDASGKDKAAQALDLVRSFTLNGDSYVTAHVNRPYAAFTDNRALFYVEAASYLSGLNAAMEDDYGVVPIPKFDTDQAQYKTWASHMGSTLVIPGSFQEPEKLGALLSTYEILSYQHVTPAYFDVILTRRNIRDHDSAEMVNIIFNNRVYDMAMYFKKFDMDTLFSNAILTADGTFISDYIKVERLFDRRLDTILQKTGE